MAASCQYNEIKHRILNILNHSTWGVVTKSNMQSKLGTLVTEFEEQIEKCILISGWVNEFQQYVLTNADVDGSSKSFERSWASIFKTILVSCGNWGRQMTEVVLPNLVRSIVLFDSNVMDAFESLSQIRKSIDTVAEQLTEVHIERASLVELEQNYFVKVGVITEKQLALEEAAVKGRDHLSWEEAEELASQEEACRAQLDMLHQTWNQKDMRTSSLLKRESSILNALLSAEHRLHSLISEEQDMDPQSSSKKAFLLALVQPFSELESVHNMLSQFAGSVFSSPTGISRLKDVNISGYTIFDNIWKLLGILKDHSFFIWKVSVMDFFLDSCLRFATSSRDQNLGFDQLVSIVKSKMAIHVQEHIGHYIKEQVAPILLTSLDKECEILKQMTKAVKDFPLEETEKAVKRVQLMLEEYCNAHETVRAGVSAASVMKRQASELKEALLKTSLDIVQMEWMHDITASPLHNCRLIAHKFLVDNDNLLPVILNLSRPRLLESIQSSVAIVARSLDCLQAFEQTSITAEVQLERAMGWACGAQNTGAAVNSSGRNSGIPPEFPEHLMKRRQFLLEAREKASDVVKVCMSILEFEASREGIFGVPGELYSVRTSLDGRTWQHAYLNALTRLDVTYHSFARTEQEWELAKSNVEVASNVLLSASNELCIASVKAKSASGDMQSIFYAMRDSAYEASVALSAFERISRSHTALTSECGSMLEEVLAVTEGVHDVQSLGKDAIALHSSLMEDLAKANGILLPLESVLSKDIAAMINAIDRERETKIEVSPIHGQAIHHSYHIRISAAYQAFKPLVPSLAHSVKGLYSLLNKLAQAANLHAGTLHKALEGLGESQELKSQGINFSTASPADADNKYDIKESVVFPKSNEVNDVDFLGIEGLNLLDRGWISPPDTIYSSSSDPGVSSTETSVSIRFTGLEVMENHQHGPISSEKEDSFVPSLSSRELESRDGPSQRDNDSQDDYVKSIQAVSVLSETKEQPSEQKLALQRESMSSNEDKLDSEHLKAPLPNIDATSRVTTRGKNAYAMAVLRRVEMKLEGRDIADNREISIAEQVNYLLEQATSVDNLCNMYEGWTPWI